MKPQAFLGSAVIALGVVTGPFLAPQAASATLLDFTFSFDSFDGRTVSGLISGLYDDTTSLPSSVFIQSVPAGFDPGGYEVCTTCSAYAGLTVTNGKVVGGAIFASQSLFPGSFVVSDLILSEGTSSLVRQVSDFGQGLSVDSVSGVTVFVPEVVSSAPESSSAVPGPLPAFGVVAALGYSRRLRKRIKGSSNTVSAAAPFA